MWERVSSELQNMHADFCGAGSWRPVDSGGADDGWKPEVEHQLIGTSLLQRFGKLSTPVRLGP